MDRFAALGAFVAVARAKSFSGAARELRLAKSAVSRHIGTLEDELGARLFHRTTRSLSLTEAGRGYFGRAERILADLDDADRAVSNLQAAPRGGLRISAPMSFGFLHLAPAIADFLARCPDVTVDLRSNRGRLRRRCQDHDTAGFEPHRPASGPCAQGCVREPRISCVTRQASASARPEGSRVPVVQQPPIGAGMAFRRPGRLDLASGREGAAQSQ